MLSEKTQDKETEALLREILKDKPETPKCPEGEEHGKVLIWTKKAGWRVG